MGVLKIILGVFSIIIVVLYYTGLYFAFAEDESENEKRKKMQELRNKVAQDNASSSRSKNYKKY